MNTPPLYMFLRPVGRIRYAYFLRVTYVGTGQVTCSAYNEAGEQVSDCHVVSGLRRVAPGVYRSMHRPWFGCPHYYVEDAPPGYTPDLFAAFAASQGAA